MSTYPQSPRISQTFLSDDVNVIQQLWIWFGDINMNNARLDEVITSVTWTIKSPNNMFSK